MAIRLGEIYAPDKINVLRVAALLHDITKELSTEDHIRLCAEYGIKLTDNDILAPKTLHARTAAAKIKRDFPEYAHEDVISAVRWHTTGKAGMSISDKLIYLADYIDDSRKFEDCVKLREFFFGFDFYKSTEDEKLAHLRDTLIYSYDMTISALLECGAPIAKDTFDARNELVCEKLKAN
jgi:nicotinate-nucleotide adenylyltransferase